jgi:hypothetical protein
MALSSFKETKTKAIYMNSTILKISAFIIILNIMGLGCEPVPPDPGISIYKTRGDYYDLVTIGMKGDKIFRSGYASESSKFIFTNNDTVYKNRARLINGYVLDSESSNEYDVFLSLTFKEYMKRAAQNETLSENYLRNYIIDKEPYTEYYRSNRTVSFSISDTAFINQLIRNGELRKFFYSEK